MKRKSKVLLVVSIILLVGVSFIIGKNMGKSEMYEEDDSSQVRHEHMLSMMLETDTGSGEYSLEERSSWPTKEEGYIFNSSLSKCEKGSKLQWDDELNAVVMVGNTSDKCYVYFDVYSPPTIADVCSNGDNLASCVKAYATTYSSDITSIYYHDSTLENGAGDNSYRYAGSSDTTNNFVCFGSDAATCPDDNLYRIIGVFGDQVKLIKWDYATSALLGTDGDYSTTCSAADYCGGDYGTSKGTNTEKQIGAYNWNYANYSATYSATNYYNVWSYSKLNTVNLNTNFLNNIGAEWANKIAETTWKVGGATYDNVYRGTAATAYTNEITNPDTTIESTYKAKVALMYTSDYGFAASPSAWTTTLYNYNSNGASGKKITDENWMYMGLYEWTVVRRSDLTNVSFLVYSGGYVISNFVDGLEFAVRPVFHLESSVNYGSGSGVKADPVRLN